MASSYYDTPFVTSVYMQTAGQLSNIIGIGSYKSFPLSFLFVSIKLNLVFLILF